MSHPIGQITSHLTSHPAPPPTPTPTPTATPKPPLSRQLSPLVPPLLPLLITLACALSALSVCACASEGDVAAEGDQSKSARGGSDDSPLTCASPPNGFTPNSVHDLGDGAHFEGWYYRVTSPGEGGEADQVWVLITAYWRDSAGAERAFVKLINGVTGRVYKRVFEGEAEGVRVGEIQAGANDLSVLLGSAEDGVSLTHEGVVGRFWTEEGEEVEVELSVEGCAYWGSPFHERDRWTMGWVTELPGPPLKWHVEHLKGSATGWVRVRGGGALLEEGEVAGAPLHQEKNWGRAFPSTWVWLQSDVFEGRPDVAFAAAGGPIFSWDWSPSGYMLGLRWRDEFLSLRTQDGHVFSGVDFKVEGGEALWSLDAEGLQRRVEVRARAPISELIEIDVPGEGGLELKAVEHLRASLEVTLYERSWLGWREVERVRSRLAAVEAGGGFARDAGLLPGAL